MLPGPVFQVELLTSARRRRYFLFRVLYVLALLLIVWQSYTSTFGYAASGGTVSNINAMSRFANNCFTGFAWLQAITVALLTPTVIAGVIADERQRKTLHYLLASQLSGAEIVLGKLMARFLHIAVILALGLPVMSLLSLFGGIDPVQVALTYSGTLTTTLMIAAISVAVSAVSKRVRDAIVASFMFGLIWLFGPFLLSMMVQNTSVTASYLLNPLFRVLVSSSPLSLVGVPAPSLGSTFGERFAWMTALQLVASALLVGVATVRLRPSFRNEGMSRLPRSLTLPRSRGRTRVRRTRPPCGDDPMLWKERYGQRTGRLALVGAVILGVGFLAGLGWAVYETIGGAVQELLAYGYGYSGDNDGVNNFNAVVRGFSVGLYCLIGLGIASAAASGIAGEKEQDTWTSLVTTDLTGEEIVRAKMLGAVWSLRWFIGLLALVLVAGLLVGSLHPFGFLAVVNELGIFFWFATALGTYFSLSCRNSTRALVWTIGTLIFISGGYLFLVLLIYDDSPIVTVASTPVIVGFSGASYSDIWGLMGFRTSAWNSAWDREQTKMVIGMIVATVGYLVAAALLTWASFARFDELVDRPRRGVGPVFVKPKPEAELA